LTLVIFAGYWCAGFVLIRAANVLPAAVSRQIGEVLAGIIAVGVAYALRVRIATYLFSAFLAFSTAEFAMDMIFRPPSVRGGGAHFALLAAAAISVTLGVFFATRSRSPREDPPDAISVDASPA
jgi:hypothetical protein